MIVKRNFDFQHSVTATLIDKRLHTFLINWQRSMKKKGNFFGSFLMPLMHIQKDIDSKRKITTTRTTTIIIIIVVKIKNREENRLIDANG